MSHSIYISFTNHSSLQGSQGLWRSYICHNGCGSANWNQLMDYHGTWRDFGQIDGENIYQTVQENCDNKHVKICGSLYGFLRSALLFSKKLVSNLEVYVLIIDQCNPCVDNIDINGTYMTVARHVENLKVLQKDYFEVIVLYTHTWLTSVENWRWNFWRYITI